MRAIKRFIFAAFLFHVFLVKAQVIDIEHLRIERDTAGFAGSIGVNLQLTKNTRNISLFSGTAYIQYTQGNHTIFFMNNTSFKKVDDEDIINKGTYHLRYNYRINHFMVLEAFGQLQYNSISKIDKRELVGGGPRFLLKNKKKYKMVLSTLFMYEYEKIIDPEEIHKDFRFSGYFTLRYNPIDNITMASTTFYQPRVDKLNDYRIFSLNTIQIKIIEKLALQIIFSINYDTYPAPGIPKTQYDLLNGIVYSFD